jgi:hypothetical protein
MTARPHTPDVPPGVPLPPVDAAGRQITVGSKARIVSVASCAKGLPAEDQARLRSYEGQTLEVVDIDRFGFVWFGYKASGGNFSLMPNEVLIV